MRSCGYGLGLAVLAMVGTLVADAPAAWAQSDWFRPPADVGQGSARQTPSQRQQTRQQPSRQQQRQAAPAQQRRQTAEPRVWTPFQPFIELFGGSPSREARPRREAAPTAAPPRAVAQQPPAEPRGKVYAGADAARSEVKDIKNVVLVLGDEQSSALAQGLADAFVTDRKGVAVVGRGEEGSGFAATGPVDWIAAGRERVGHEQPNVVVVLAGLNDLRPGEDGTSLTGLFDERQREVYARRIDEFLLGLRLAGRPVVVVGLPPVEDEALNARVRQFNALLREHVESAGFLFVDVTDGFVDENGKFVMSGPAVDGQRRRLRTEDGVGFTRAGARKLAFFVDQRLEELLSREDLPVSAVDPAEARPTIIMLTGGAGIGARTLAGAPEAGASDVWQASVAASMAQTAVGSDGASPQAEPASVLLSGAALPVVAGRMDDFRWPPAEPGGASTQDVPGDGRSEVPHPVNAAPASPPIIMDGLTPSPGTGTVTP